MSSTVVSALPAPSDALAQPIMPAPRAPVSEKEGSGRWLPVSVAAWFAAMAIGQLMMVAYVLGFYLRAALAGEPERWNRVLYNGYVPGDGPGNLALVVHLLFSVVIVVGGIAQLLPPVRRRWPTFHRWNGRLYLVSAVLMSVGGTYLIWTRPSLSGLANDIAITLNALLILGFAFMAWRNAMARRFERHRRWALRLFLAVSGVWFFRVGLMFWLLVNQGPVGFDAATFRGPALVILSFVQFLVPLAVLEWYFRVQDRGGGAHRVAFGMTLAVLTALMVVGIVAATMMMWLPGMLSNPATTVSR